MSLARRWGRGLGAFVAVLVLSSTAGCSSKDATGVDTVEGSYALARIDGHALPYDFDGEVWESMTMTLTNGRVSGTLKWRETDSAGRTVDQGSDSFAGVYTADGTRLTLRIEDDPPATAVIAGKVLTMTADFGVLVFERR